MRRKSSASQNLRKAAGMLFPVSSGRLTSRSSTPGAINLRIHGIKERPQESTDDAICRLADQLRYAITPAVIDRSYRTSPGGGNGAAVDRSKDRPIVVQFGAYRTKVKFYSSPFQAQGDGYIYIYIYK